MPSEAIIHTLSEWFPLINFVVLLILGVVLLVLLMKSRNWTAVALAAKIEHMDQEIGSLRAKVLGLDVDVQASVRNSSTVTDRLVKEVRGTTEIVAELRRDMVVLRDDQVRLDTLERHVETCPIAREAELTRREEDK